MAEAREEREEYSDLEERMNRIMEEMNRTWEALMGRRWGRQSMRTQSRRMLPGERGERGLIGVP